VKQINQSIHSSDAAEANTRGVAEPGVSTTQSLDRALALLDVVVARAVQGISLGEAAEVAGLSKPTAHRLLTGLRNAGLVDYVTQQRRFFPAFKLLRMGQAVSARFDIVQLAAPCLQRLAQETGDTVYLQMRSGDFSVCAARYTGDFPIKMLTLDVGDLRPLGVGSNGLVMLAALPDGECARIVALHAEALNVYEAYRPESMAKLLIATRKNGYGLNQGQMLPEMSAIAMGVRSPEGEVTASVSVAAITSRLQEPRLSTVRELLRREITEIEARMARPPGD
jgi:DNA-binding IclR family transcriptional regulator